jgi:hypothetical protein
MTGGGQEEGEGLTFVRFVLDSHDPRVSTADVAAFGDVSFAETQIYH